jgi:hypothetical protein
VLLPAALTLFAGHAVHEWLPTPALKEAAAHGTQEPPSDVCPSTHTQSMAAVALTLSSVVLFGGHRPHVPPPPAWAARRKLPEGQRRQLITLASTDTTFTQRVASSSTSASTSASAPRRIASQHSLH